MAKAVVKWIEGKKILGSGFNQPFCGVVYPR